MLEPLKFKDSYGIIIPSKKGYANLISYNTELNRIELASFLTEMNMLYYLKVFPGEVTNDDLPNRLTHKAIKWIFGDKR